MNSELAILGAGVTGLASGRTSGGVIYESEAEPGGICSSYYLSPRSEGRGRDSSDALPSAYRFELGGGHWIFGGDPFVLRFIESLVSTKSYRRNSGVYVSSERLFVPYPIQNHLRLLDSEIASRALSEMTNPADREPTTMAEWLEKHFGRTLLEYFFGPFHERYTAGLWTGIQPQDAYKTPINIEHVVRGSAGDAPPVGYNTTFIYPEKGLGELARRIAADCRIEYQRRAVAIDVDRREVLFEDGSGQRYTMLVSTLPLHRTLQMTGLEVDEKADPFTSVLVLNIGAIRAQDCPHHHWLYIPDSASGFHRIGFYSNVDGSFLPSDGGDSSDRVSIYVERSYQGGERPTSDEIDSYARDVVRELTQWQFIREVEVLDPTWIDVAYTWSWPGSRWRKRAMEVLQERHVFPAGRYGRWIFQGIADSFRDGFIAGAALRI
jgi:protoporphyrinogen oxidase